MNWVHRPLRRRYGGALVGLCLLAGCAPAASAPAPSDAPRGTTVPPPLWVAAASDLRPAMERLVELFERQQGNIRVEVIYGSSGQFYAQIRQGAPFDLFFSADVSYPQRLVEEGLAIPSSLFRYARGQIVLWTRSDSPLPVETQGFEVLRDPQVRKIAIAHPEHAPYGRAAVAALRHFGLYEQVEPRLVRAENIAQAAQFVQSGAADVGILALSLASAPPLQDAGRLWRVPLESYPPLVQGGVILRSTRAQAAAEALSAFVLSDEGQAILREYGFTAAEE